MEPKRTEPTKPVLYFWPLKIFLTLFFSKAFLTSFAHTHTNCNLILFFFLSLIILVRMSCSSKENGACTSQKKYKGGSSNETGQVGVWNSSPRHAREALACFLFNTRGIARDVSFYCLHKPSTLEKFRGCLVFFIFYYSSLSFRHLLLVT